MAVRVRELIGELEDISALYGDLKLVVYDRGEDHSFEINDIRYLNGRDTPLTPGIVLDIHGTGYDECDL